jgi:hypothetical protein
MPGKNGLFHCCEQKNREIASIATLYSLWRKNSTTSLLREDHDSVIIFVFAVNINSAKKLAQPIESGK